MSASLSGAVLTGGRSERMGTDKAFVVHEGQMLLERAIGALRSAGAEPIRCIGGDLERLSDCCQEVIADPEPHAGPLRGLLAALEQPGPDAVGVLAVDHLWPSAPLLCRLDRERARIDADVAIALHGGFWQVLHAVWHRRAHKALAAAFAGGERSIRGTLGELEVATVTWNDPRSFRDADSPEDLVP